MKNKVYNPLFNGDFIADVEAHTFGGVTYFYGSKDCKTDEWCSDTYKVYSTADFTSVVDHGESLKIDQLGDKNLRLMYAPDAINRDGITHLFVCCDDGSEWALSSTTPSGNFGKPIKFDVSGIDPSIFIDDDGKIYYFWGQFSLYGARLNSDLSGVDRSTIKSGIITEKEHFFHEGSSIRKRNGIYYLVFADVSRGESERFGGKPTCLGYATATSPLGKYTYRGVIIDNAPLDENSWNNHGSINQIDGEWYVFYHSSTNNSQYLRRSRVEKISFDENGLIPEVEPTSSGAADFIFATENITAGMCCGAQGGYICVTEKQDCLKVTNKQGEFIFRYIKMQGEKKLTIKVKGRGKITFLFKKKTSMEWGTLAIINCLNSSSNEEIVSQQISDIIKVSEVIQIKIILEPISALALYAFSFSL